MIEAPFALAFTAGLVATVNPCGFAMLPAYLSYFLGTTGDEAGSGTATPVARGLVIGAVVSSGFLVVFGVAGFLVTLGLRSIISAIPWAAIVIGAGLVVLGAAMLAGYEPVLRLPGPGRGVQGRSHGAVFVFGISYAIASLSCTLPIFLTVVAGAIPQTNLVGGVLLFLVYGAGMSLVLLVVTLALAVGKERLVGRLRRSAAHVNRVSGAILVLAGAYIVWFWVTSLGNPLAATGPVTVVEQWSSRLTQLIGDRPVVSGGMLAAVVLVAVVQLVRAPRGPSRP